MILLTNFARYILLKTQINPEVKIVIDLTNYNYSPVISFSLELLLANFLYLI